MAQAVFRRSELVREPSSQESIVSKIVGPRVFGPAARNVVCELVPSAIESIAGDVCGAQRITLCAMEISPGRNGRFPVTG